MDEKSQTQTLDGEQEFPMAAEAFPTIVAVWDVILEASLATVAAVSVAFLMTVEKPAAALFVAASKAFRLDISVVFSSVMHRPLRLGAMIGWTMCRSLNQSLCSRQLLDSASRNDTIGLQTDRWSYGHIVLWMWFNSLAGMSGITGS